MALCSLPRSNPGNRCIVSFGVHPSKASDKRTVDAFRTKVLREQLKKNQDYRAVLSDHPVGRRPQRQEFRPRPRLYPQWQPTNGMAREDGGTAFVDEALDHSRT